MIDVIKKEGKKVKKKEGNDGTTHESEAVNIILRFVSDALSQIAAWDKINDCSYCQAYPQNWVSTQLFFWEP